MPSTDRQITTLEGVIASIGTTKQSPRFQNCRSGAQLYARWKDIQYHLDRHEAILIAEENKERVIAHCNNMAAAISAGPIRYCPCCKKPL